MFRGRILRGGIRCQRRPRGRGAYNPRISINSQDDISGEPRNTENSNSNRRTVGFGTSRSNSRRGGLNNIRSHSNFDIDPNNQSAENFDNNVNFRNFLNTKRSG